MTSRRVVPRRSEGGRVDAVVLHGMLSGAGSMAPLARALTSRNHYRHIARYQMPSWRHRWVPQTFAESNAEELVAKKINPALARGTLKAPLDLIGHSNGGYVCLYIADVLGPSIVRSVYTLGSPRGVPQDYPVPARISTRLFHLRGGVDGVPTGGDHAPGDGAWVITFPDEGHCSLHRAADTNGVADLICFLAGMDSPHLFIDENATIHPWAWCANDVVQGSRRLLGSAHQLQVCDGVHDALLDWLKAARTVIGRSDSLVARVAVYLAIRERLVARKEALDGELSEARAFGRGLRQEMAELQAENKDLANRLEEFDRRIQRVSTAFKTECQIDLGQITDALSTCERLANGPTFGDREMAEVNGLLAVALHSHRRLNQSVQARAKLLATAGTS